MPFVETRFISPTTLTTSAASALYTVPTGYSAIIKQLVVTNITGTAATFTFYIGAASAGNALFSGTSVAANDTVIINLSQVVTTEETLRALASTNSALNLTVSGVINDGPLASTATYIADNAITTAKIADASVNTAKIADGAIVTVDIANTAVTSAKLADSLALTGTPTAPTASAGTNTTQLATTAFANTAGGLVLISTYTVGSGITTFDIGTMNSTYDNYRLVWSGLTPSTNGQDMYMTLVTSGGSESASGYLNQVAYVTNANAFAASYASRAYLVCASSSTTAHKFSGIIELFAPAVADYTYMTSTAYLNRNDIVGFGFNGRQESATAYSTVRFRFSAGSVTGGTMSLYGYRK
jgi:hypothetical protein